MTKSTITREQAQKIIVAADEVITALAGTNEDVHPDDSKKMCELWDDLNDRHAPPVVVRELARMALAALDSEPVAYIDKQWTLVYYVPPMSMGLKIGDKLYRHAQPALVVPDEIKHRIGGLDWGWEGEFNRGWNACRAAMLQASPVCTCPSGDGSLRWSCPVHPGSSPVIPDGYVMVPMRLTAENGAKGALSGEFSETKFVNCPECFGDDECETCDGSGRIEITVPVTWTTIKEIWAKGVEHFAAAPQSPGSEPATVPGKWIPVSERMPEVGDIVLTAMGGVVNVGEMECSAANCRFFTSVISGRELPATHWLPLPAGPKEDINALIPLVSRNEQEGK